MKKKYLSYKSLFHLSDWQTQTSENETNKKKRPTKCYHMTSSKQSGLWCRTKLSKNGKNIQQSKFSWQGRKRSLWTLAREIKLKLHITLISHWKPQTIPGKEETIMLSLMLDVSNLSKHFSILWEGTKVPRVFHLPFPQDLEAVVLPVILSFNLGSSFTIVSFYWLVSSRLSPWRWKVDMQALDNQATAGK